MRLLIPFALVWVCTVILCRRCNASFEQRSKRMPESAVYINMWAAEVYGGKQEADRVARKHGFVNLGQVRTEKYTGVTGYLSDSIYK